jgi:hypothetical protein
MFEGSLSVRTNSKGLVRLRHQNRQAAVEFNDSGPGGFGDTWQKGSWGGRAASVSGPDLSRSERVYACRSRPTIDEYGGNRPGNLFAESSSQSI